MAKIFGAKFDMISPVWLQIVHKGKNQYEIAGTHDVDAKWIQDVRKAGPPGKKSKFTELEIFDILDIDLVQDLLKYIFVD